MKSFPFPSVLLALGVTLVSHTALAQEAANLAAPAASAPYVPKPWIYQTPKLNKSQVDALLAEPDKVLILDIRRPEEIVRWGSFQVYLNVQLSDLPQAAAFIPRDRTIVAVSNRANRGGHAGDILRGLGFKVAGATGSEDYRLAGGTIYKPERPAAPAAAR